MTTDKGFTDY